MPPILPSDKRVEPFGRYVAQAGRYFDPPGSPKVPPTGQAPYNKLLDARSDARPKVRAWTSCHTFHLRGHNSTEPFSVAVNYFAWCIQPPLSG